MRASYMRLMALRLAVHAVGYGTRGLERIIRATEALGGTASRGWAVGELAGVRSATSATARAASPMSSRDEIAARFAGGLVLGGLDPTTQAYACVAHAVTAGQAVDAGALAWVLEAFSFDVIAARLRERPPPGYARIVVVAARDTVHTFHVKVVATTLSRGGAA